jgi:hypothetical protein
MTASQAAPADQRRGDRNKVSIEFAARGSALGPQALALVAVCVVLSSNAWAVSQRATGRIGRAVVPLPNPPLQPTSGRQSEVE